jgi:CheY-like chemotaxis protein
VSGDGPHIIIVDDDLAMASTAKVLLEKAGYRVSLCDSAIRALEEIPSQRPACVLLDIMMPEMDGLELCRQLREMPALCDLKIIMFSSKAFKYDRDRSAELGADGYILKPIKPETFLDQVRKVVEDKIALTFWGVRGTLPRPGRGSVRYGGNTNCVTLECPNGPLVILDAGTGIKSLSDHLMADGAQRIEAKILISHPHWDHINCLPFFVPLYIPGNEVEIIGADQAGTTVRDFVSAQMDGVYFPITIREFGARIEFRDLREGQYQVGAMNVETMLLSHPGNCLGYRLTYRGRSVCYITDNELFLPDSEFYAPDYVDRLTKFVEGAEALITDVTYTDAEYPRYVGFGHSAVGPVVDMAARAGIGTLYLFHHDPDQDDDAIDRKLEEARQRLRDHGSPVVCEAPAEGDFLLV